MGSLPVEVALAIFGPIGVALCTAIGILWRELAKRPDERYIDLLESIVKEKSEKNTRLEAILWESVTTGRGLVEVATSRDHPGGPRWG